MNAGDRPTDTGLWMRWVEANLTELSTRIRSLGAATGGGGGGTITSVNGDTGPAVTLDAADVGADPAGSAAAAQAASQPLDTDLTAIAALSTTSYGRALLALADAAAARTALALGSAATHDNADYDAAGAAAAAQAASQPLDSDLTAIAALSTTSYGRAFLALADAAAARTALALGGAAVLNVGTTAGTVAAGDAAPKAHAASHAIGGSDALTFPSRILGSTAPTISPGIVNTTAETDLWSLTVPAASVASGDLLVVEFAYDMLNNSGGAVTFQFKVKLGATTVLTTPLTSYATNANRIEGLGRIALQLATLTDQRVWASVTADSPTAQNFSFIVAGNSLTGVGTATENLATDKTLAMTVKMDTASASADVRCYGAVLTRVR